MNTCRKPAMYSHTKLQNFFISIRMKSAFTKMKVVKNKLLDVCCKKWRLVRENCMDQSNSFTKTLKSFLMKNYTHLIGKIRTCFRTWTWVLALFDSVLSFSSFYSLALQFNESLRLLYGPLRFISVGRPLLLIKYFTFLHISFPTVPPTNHGSSAESIFL